MARQPWTAEIEVTAALAQALITEQFPDLAGASLRPLGAGWDNAAFLVDEQFVFRFPRREFAVPFLVTETAVLSAIAAQLPLPVPNPQFFGRLTALYPWPFTGYAMIAGTPVCSVALSAKDRSALASPLAQFLRSLHCIDPQPAVERGLKRDEIGRLDPERRLPQARERFAQLEEAGLVADKQPFLDFMTAHPPTPHEPRVIVHGDLYARHVLVNESTLKLSGIIDWGDVHLGDPALDLEIAYTLLPKEDRLRFFDAYGEVSAATRERAMYRAIYHSALVAHYARAMGDAALLDAGLSGLRFVAELL